MILAGKFRSERPAELLWQKGWKTFLLLEQMLIDGDVQARPVGDIFLANTCQHSNCFRYT